MNSVVVGYFLWKLKVIRLLRRINEPVQLTANQVTAMDHAFKSGRNPKDFVRWLRKSRKDQVQNHLGKTEKVQQQAPQTRI